MNFFIFVILIFFNQMNDGYCVRRRVEIEVNRFCAASGYTFSVRPLMLKGRDNLVKS
jgi:hypothetical protein